MTPSTTHRSSYQVGPGIHVTLAYDVFDGDGERVDGSVPEAPLTLVHGFGELLPALEQALEGMSAGQSKQVLLRPRDAYGPRRPDAVLEVDRDEFPPEVEPGDRYELENAEGGLLVLKVLDVDDSRVVLDANHPLAGQNVRFELRVLEARPATSQELAVAEARLNQPGAPVMPGGLLSPECLIRAPRRRYEHEPSSERDPRNTNRKPNGEQS